MVKHHTCKILLAIVISSAFVFFGIGCTKITNNEVKLTCITPNNTVVVYETTESNIRHYYDAGVVEVKDHSNGVLVEYPINSCTMEKRL